MSNEFLKKKFSELSDKELLSIVNESRKDYTREALEIAKEEIKRRSLAGEINTENEDKSENKSGGFSISDNIISTVIKLIGAVVIISGIILGIIVTTSSDDLTGFGIIISGFVSGFLFLGLGEIINLLHQINERQKVKQKGLL